MGGKVVIALSIKYGLTFFRQAQLHAKHAKSYSLHLKKVTDPYSCIWNGRPMNNQISFFTGYCFQSRIARVDDDPCLSFRNTIINRERQNIFRYHKKS